jgi:hypothetical protein
VSEIPDALVEEAASSYQRMRFGLASSLMGDGYYSYDLGATFHGQFWWYDEYGRMISEGTTSSLPPQGYLGQPVGDPYTIKSTPESHTSRTFQQFIKDLMASPQEDIKSYEVWVRKFEHGIAIVNPTETVRSLELDAQYCRLNGTQAPLSTVRVDDNEIEFTDGWKQLTASYDQFGNTVRTISSVKNATLTYRPNLLYSGQYEVLVWVAPGANQVDKVDYDVIYTGGDVTVTVDQTTGEPGWRSLGIYSFEKGKDQKVKIHSSSAGTVIADAIKWVSIARFNDGSQISKLEIQPFDGIILVNCELNEGGN